ncbi:hypothetical protein EON67_10400, partial [archaeon]
MSRPRTAPRGGEHPSFPLVAGGEMKRFSTAPHAQERPRVGRTPARRPGALLLAWEELRASREHTAGSTPFWGATCASVVATSDGEEEEAVANGGVGADPAAASVQILQTRLLRKQGMVGEPQPCAAAAASSA